MIKKILISTLVAVVAVGVAVSAYNVVAGPAAGDKTGAVSSAQETVPPIGGSEQASALSNAPLGDPSAGATAQGSGRQVGAASQGSSWQSDAAAQSGGQGNRYGQGQGGQGQGGQGQGGQGQGGQGQGGQGQGGQGQGGQSAGTGAGIPAPQAAQNELITLHGVVSNYAAPNFTLITDDGQSIAVQLGNQRFVSDLGIVLQEGQAVTLVGFYETSDSFAASTLTLDASGQTYTLRDQASGRPLWAGGPKNH